MLDDATTALVSLKRRFPILRLSEAAAISLSPASVIVAMITWILLMASFDLIDSVLVPDYRIIPRNSPLHRWIMPKSSMTGFPYSVSSSLAGPMTTTILPTATILSDSPSLKTRLNAFLKLASAIGFWSIAGLFLCRRSAILFGDHHESTIKASLDYTRKGWQMLALSPLIPLSAAFLIGLIVIVWGIPGRIPYLGPSWLLIMSPLLMLGGLAMAVLLMATAAGWPLMVAAAATEDGDSFGSLSRAFSGLSSRLLQVLCYAAICLVVGIGLLCVVTILADLTIWGTMGMASIGAGTRQAQKSLVEPVTWMARGIEQGIGISYFWSAATVIYLFLRHDIDGLPFEKISGEPPASRRDPLPVVGIPATDSKLASNGEASQ